MRIRYCAQCGCEIKECDDGGFFDDKSHYFKILDNYLQLKYFDEEKDNIFCSKDCLCKALSVQEYVFNSHCDDNCEYENETESDNENPL